MTRLPIVDFVKFIEQGYKEHWAYTMGTRCQNIQTGYLDLSKKERKNSSWARNGWFVTQYKDNAKQYKKALEDWDRGGRCSDCNGLAEGFYEIKTGVSIDSKARYNYAQWCDPKGSGMIPPQYRTPGAAVFWSGTTSNPGKATKIHHVAYLYKPVDENNPSGDWYILEERGKLYGLVRTKLYERKPDFWGWMTKYYDYEITPTPIPTGIKRGDKGDDVKKIQNQLITLGYDLSPYGADGDFGAKTENAVKAFQKDNKLSETGIVDDTTKKLLDERTTTVKSDYEITGGSVWIWTLPPNCGGEKQEVLHKGDQCGKPDVGDYLPIMWNGKMAWVNKKYVKES